MNTVTLANEVGVEWGYLWKSNATQAIIFSCVGFKIIIKFEMNYY
jgi:hypothetical protein